MTEVQYLVFETSSNKIAINLQHVLEVIRIPKWTPYPNSNDHIKGIFNLRNKIIPLIDFRKLLGYKSFDEENNDLIGMLKHREQDHINWLNELEKSVIEDRDFTLTTDPKKCKFGQWYYSFKAENSSIDLFLKEFEEPHNSIHNIAVKAKDLVSQKRKNDAIKLVNDSKNKELKKMIGLFHDLYTIIGNSNKEFVVIIQTDNGIKSFTVDKIDQIIKVADNEISLLESAELKGTAKEVIKRDNDIILKLDIMALLDQV